MDWGYYASPYYLLLVGGPLAALAAGSAFAATLKDAVQEWRTEHATQTLADLRLRMIAPFLAMASGICVFLAAGVNWFGFPLNIAFGVSVVLTVFTVLLVWVQLNRLLVQLEKGNRDVLNLDALFF